MDNHKLMRGESGKRGAEEGRDFENVNFAGFDEKGQHIPLNDVWMTTNQVVKPKQTRR